MTIWVTSYNRYEHFLLYAKECCKKSNLIIICFNVLPSSLLHKEKKIASWFAHLITRHTSQNSFSFCLFSPQRHSLPWEWRRKKVDVVVYSKHITTTDVHSEWNTCGFSPSSSFSISSLSSFLFIPNWLTGGRKVFTLTRRWYGGWEGMKMEIYNEWARRRENIFERKIFLLFYYMYIYRNINIYRVWYYSYYLLLPLLLCRFHSLGIVCAIINNCIVKREKYRERFVCAKNV